MIRSPYSVTAQVTQRRHIRFIHILLFSPLILTLSIVSSVLALQADAGSPTNPLQSKDPNAPNCGPNWTIVTSPNPGSFHYLEAVDAVAANDVWAVGHYSASGQGRTLIERWNGTGWNVVPSPNVGTLGSSLLSVDVVSANDIWAVGRYYSYPEIARTLTIHWDGSTWSIVPSPNNGQSSNILWGVSAVSANDVWAVGHYETSTGTERTLTLHLIGGIWQVVASPNLSSTLTTLRDITAISANDIWAVGFYKYSVDVYRTLTMHWDGSTWSVVPSPNVSSTNNGILGVTAISASNVWAVGSYTNGTNPTRTLIVQWDGSAWNVITSPNVGTDDHTLWGVSAVSANDVWAVGYRLSGQGPRTLIVRWNGNEWTVVTSPNTGDSSTLKDVAAVSANDVWAIGTYREGVVESTLMERYNPCVASPTPTTTSISSSTPTSTDTPEPTQTPGGPTATATPVACTIEFTDVPPGSTFYDFVRCMVCRGIINGYTADCETGNPCFRPGNLVTRGQLAKIVSNAAAFNEPAGAQQYEDVPPGSTFYDFVWRLADRGHVGGYACGGVGEPCGTTNLPYFRPNGNASRGQISKIVANAAGLSDPTGTQLFEDVPASHTFYEFIQRLANLSVLGGYACGGVGEPCGIGNLPYFRPASSVTRGQTSKIVANAFFPDCQTPAGILAR